MLFSDFRASGPINIPTPLILALKMFSHADAVMNVYPFAVSWYLISLLWMYLHSCMHIMPMLLSIANATRSVSCPILRLNIAIYIVRLHFSNSCFSLSSVAVFRTLMSGLQRQQDAPLFFTCAKSEGVWRGGFSVGHGNLSMAVLILIYGSHTYKWAAVVPRSNYLILAVKL